MLFGTFIIGNHSRCPLTLMSNDCKANINPLNYALMHLGIILEITNVIPIFNALVALAALIFLFYISKLFDSGKFIFNSRKINYFFNEDGRQSVKEKTLKWTALHEKRDYLSALTAGS